MVSMYVILFKTAEPIEEVTRGLTVYLPQGLLHVPVSTAP